MAKWKDLKKAGIRRCCVVFTNRKRCRSRVEADQPQVIPHSSAFDGGLSTEWCERHAPIMAQAKHIAQRGIAAEGNHAS